MTRRVPIPAWTETVPCATCGAPRSITANHPGFFVRAARKSCHRCVAIRNAPQSARRAIQNGPTRPYAKQYIPDETVVDWVVVDRLMSGHPQPGSTREERVAAVAALTALGMSATSIAERMHVTDRTVTRLRASVRQEVAAA